MSGNPASPTTPGSPPPQSVSGGGDEYTARYTVTKHSWKGKYTRLFCIGKSCFATINPGSIFKVTNNWPLNTVIDITPKAQTSMDISVIVRIKGKPDETTFSCMSAGERAELLTDVQELRSNWDPMWRNVPDGHSFNATKFTASEDWRRVQLLVTNTAVIVRQNGVEVGKYYFMHISATGRVEDKENGVVIQHGRRKRLHLYCVERPDAFLKLVDDMALKYVGLPQAKRLDPMQSFQVETNRLGVNRGDLASTADFPVLKHSIKHADAPVRRQLSTTAACILERDPASYNAVNAYHLMDVFALVRCEDDAQKFMIEYKNPHVVKVYTSPVRDAVLAHLVDSCRISGNTNVSVRMRRVDRGKRAAPVRVPVADEIESTLLKCLIEPQKGGGPTTMPFSEVVEFFNANVEYSGLRCTENKEGLFAENREKLIFGAFNALLENFPVTEDPSTVVQQFYALRRLSVTRIGFSSAAVVPMLIKQIGAAAVRALKMHHMAVAHAVMDFLSTLMTPHHDNYDVAHEQINKNKMLSSESFIKHLLQLLLAHTEQDSGALVIQSLLDFFVASLCPPYSSTTEEGNFHSLLQQFVTIMGKPVFQLFHHTCRNIQFNAGMLVRVIMEEGDEDQFFTMQRAALSEGGFLRLFHVAAYNDKDRTYRDLSRKLIALWTYENTTTQDLMRRMIPVTLLHFLQSKELPPEEERETEVKKNVKEATDEWRESKNAWFQKRFHPKEVLGNHGDSAESQLAVVYRNREVKVVPSLNWPLFFYNLKRDHLRPDLIWNHNTRNELKEALEAEMHAFQQGLELRKERVVCWNHQELEIQYPSLADELKIGNHYPRLLFESANPQIARPKEFFNDMYHRFLLVQDFNLKCQCLHGMAILYEHYAEEIGQFHDIEFTIQMLENCSHPLFRDRMIQFIGMLLRTRLNVKPFINANGLKPLVDLLPLAHLHVDRPQIHSSTGAIEGPSQQSDIQDQEKEWHYSTKQGEKQDPVSFTALRNLYKEDKIGPNTKVWAQGLGGWKDLKDVPQLRWGVVNAHLTGVMTLSELSCNILDILLLLCAYYPSRDQDGAVMQPLPRVKRYLSEPGVLPHIVQLLLTFDPTICGRVHRLIFLLMEDNPLMPRFFLNGVFFFSLMYTGSDIIPLCRLLHLSHRKQSFHFNHDNEVIRSSVLSPMLPPAMVCFLNNHGPEKFAGVFLGEYETPEAIWGKDMRRVLIGKIAAHIADFTPRLLGNIRVVYQYCPILPIEYEQLKDELFCSQYYLRHLCDTIKYPTWPIADPVELMRDTLKAWRLELEKEPTKLNRESCLETLEIKEPDPTPGAIRKAYFKLAAVYHPDKNPAGREMFEAIQEAYSFLASDKVASVGPDPIRISLLLRTQSILFARFSEKMAEYKYAGYELLIKLIRQEQEDPEMLRKPISLMDPATELCYYTVANAPLNADELMQEKGFELLAAVLNRVYEQVTPATKDGDVQARIAANIIRTFGVAARFRDCAHKIVEQPDSVIHATRSIAYEKAPALCKASIDAVIAFCWITQLQDLVTRAGAIWHLLLYIFRYDTTLEDSGVEINETNHTQLFANRTAIAALKALYALAGYRPTDEYPETKPNVDLHKMLQSLLTPFIVNKMRTEKEGEVAVLKYLNSNHETPYFLWNNTSRAELKDFCRINSELCRDGASMASLDHLPPMSVEGFSYSAHSKELMVGGIFVRIYNQQPLYTITDPDRVFQDFITYLQDCLSSGKPEQFSIVMEAMKNLMISYHQLNIIAAAYIHVLFSALSVNNVEANIRTFELLTKCCGSPNCIEAVGQIPSAFTSIILAFERSEKVHREGIALICQLLTDSSCVQQFLDRGMYVILLHVFGTSRNPDTKEAACVCMSKACADKLNGPKVRLRSMKLMPVVFLETMKENPTQCCQMFETWQENPELVWNAESRDRCVAELAKCKSNLIDAVTHDPCAHWRIPDEVMMAEQRIEDFQVGDVYLSLFVKQPNWGVRHPREFLISLLERFVELASAQEPKAEHLQLVSQATMMFLGGQPTMTDHIVALGYIEKLFKLAESSKAVVAQGAVNILHEICNSKACVESMNRFDPVYSIMHALEHFEDVGMVMDTLERLMSRSSEKANMVKLALNNKLIQKLLSMLETGMTGSGNAAASRAIIIRAIKAIQKVEDPVYGGNVDAILKESPIWWKYKDQNHDLFLTQGQFGGYLTGPAASSQQTLYLAAPPVHHADDVPPPLEGPD
jgi:DnaJ family protein C protein 13